MHLRTHNLIFWRSLQPFLCPLIYWSSVITLSLRLQLSILHQSGSTPSFSESTIAVLYVKSWCIYVSFALLLVNYCDDPKWAHSAAFTRHWIGADSTSSRWISVESMLIPRCVLSWMLDILPYSMFYIFYNIIKCMSVCIDRSLISLRMTDDSSVFSHEVGLLLGRLPHV